MLTWFLRQRFADKIAVMLAVLVLVPALWTALSSFLFLRLMGAWLQQQYPLDDINSYWIWWVYYVDRAAQPLRTQQWLAVSGIAAALPFGAFLIRQIMDHFSRGGTGQSVYGTTQWADRKQMASRDISTRRRPF